MAADRQYAKELCSLKMCCCDTACILLVQSHPTGLVTWYNHAIVSWFRVFVSNRGRELTEFSVLKCTVFTPLCPTVTSVVCKRVGEMFWGHFHTELLHYIEVYWSIYSGRRLIRPPPDRKKLVLISGGFINRRPMRHRIQQRGKSGPWRSGFNRRLALLTVDLLSGDHCICTYIEVHVPNLLPSI